MFFILIYGFTCLSGIESVLARRLRHLFTKFTRNVDLNLFSKPFLKFPERIDILVLVYKHIHALSDHLGAEVFIKEASRKTEKKTTIIKQRSWVKSNNAQNSVRT